MSKEKVTVVTGPYMVPRVFKERRPGADLVRAAAEGCGPYGPGDRKALCSFIEGTSDSCSVGWFKACEVEVE